MPVHMESSKASRMGSVCRTRGLKNQLNKGYLIELSTKATSVAGTLEAYGVAAGNVGINDVGKFHSREWSPSDTAFSAASPGPNILCLHDGLTPYCSDDADIDLDRLFAHSRISFDCVLIGDEHRPKDKDFTAGYTFEADNGTPVFYTGPAVRITEPYRDCNAFVTELTISAKHIVSTRDAI